MKDNEEFNDSNWNLHAHFFEDAVRRWYLDLADSQFKRRPQLFRARCYARLPDRIFSRLFRLNYFKMETRLYHIKIKPYFPRYTDRIDLKL